MTEMLKMGAFSEQDFLDSGYSLISKRFVKYPDCNATENLFGGNLLAWIDESAAIFASLVMKTDSIVTANFGELNFQKPTPLKSVLSIYIKTIREGNTSLTVHAVATKTIIGKKVHEDIVGETSITFVCINELGKPISWRNE